MHLSTELRRLVTGPCVAGFSLLTAPAIANPYDDCILQHMGTAQSDTAVNAIERACIDKTSVVIPPDDNFAGGLDAGLGKFNTGSGAAVDYGLLVTMENSTHYYVTEVVVSVFDKSTKKVTRYSVDTFDAPLPSGTFLTKLGEPAYRWVIKPGTTRQFFVHINEATQTASDFAKKFAWGVMPTKGIPAD
jgi:hypothetical protein